MFTLLLTPAYLPFALTFAVMLGVGVIEAIGLGVGQFDVDFDAHGDVEGGTVLDWLGIGAGLPILIWLTALLGCFTISGIALQQITTMLSGTPFHPALASVGALLIGGAGNSFASRGLARIMPSYESSVISTDDLVMRRATILEGTARRGHPARAKVIDQHKQAHFIMVEPHNDDDVIRQGEIVTLVRRDGARFFVLPDVHPVLRPVE
jgi:hypothetical protein